MNQQMSNALYQCDQTPVVLKVEGTQEFMGIEIPVVVGGFGEDNKVVTDKMVAEIHKMEVKNVRARITDNIKRFKFNIDIIDVLNCCLSDKQQLLEQFGYSKMQISKAEHIYILSERGYSKLIKIMDTDLAWEIHDKLVDDYFTLREQVKNQYADSYMIQDPVERARAWIKEQEERQSLRLINTQQQQIIGELKPKADYTDHILKSKALMTITAIAKDYGMSGNEMNNKLHELGVQYKQGNQWFLYAKYQACGYTHSETISFKRRDGSEDTTLHTKWTQKGRLFIYNLLKENDILPMIERRDEE